jgi:hypothetical protein
MALISHKSIAYKSVTKGIREDHANKTHIFFPLALQPTFGPWPTSMKLSVSLQFTRYWPFGRTPWTGDQLVARPLPVHKLRKTHIHKH